MGYLVTAAVVFVCLAAAMAALQSSWIASTALLCFAAWFVHKQATGWRTTRRG